MTTFHSTRSTTDSLTSKQAIRKGIADDGGLFVTDSLGETHVDIASLAGKSYQQIAFDVLSVLLPDYTEAELKECIDEAYGPQWSDEKITPVKPLGDDYVMELFNGPTSAFKDVALQILPRFMARTTPADGDADEKIMIVTATSGDTGKAALAGFADAAGTGITVFYPEGKVSQVQELQMTTQSGSNVNVCAVKGNFDDAQSAVKRIFGDKELAERLADDSHVVLSSANSINVGRLVPQVVYYFSAYAQLLERQVINVGDEVEFVVPTGNFGDILAGYYAKMLGLPGQASCGGVRQEQRVVRLPDFRHVQPSASVLPDHFPVDGYPHLIEPGAHAVLHVRQGHTPDLHADERSEPVGRLRGSRADDEEDSFHLRHRLGR